MNDVKLSKNELIDYIYYSENDKLVAVLNTDNIKEFLNVDELAFEENEHR